MRETAREDTVATEHRPIQTEAELRFPPFAHGPGEAKADPFVINGTALTPSDDPWPMPGPAFTTRSGHTNIAPFIRRVGSAEDRSGWASSGLWFDGWKGRSPPPFGRYPDQHRRCEVAEPRTWLLEKGWRRIGLVDPAELPGKWPRQWAAGGDVLGRATRRKLTPRRHED